MPVVRRRLSCTHKAEAPCRQVSAKKRASSHDFATTFADDFRPACALDVRHALPMPINYLFTGRHAEARDTTRRRLRGRHYHDTALFTSSQRHAEGVIFTF